MRNLIDRRKGGDVKRFHTVTMQREHLVSSHSFNVALIVLEIFPNASAAVIKAALYHDLEEAVVGDMPATTKWNYPDLADALKIVEGQVTASMGLALSLTDWEKELLKTADLSDLVLSCFEEYRLGNKGAWEIVQRGLNWLEDNTIHKMTREFISDLRAYVRENKDA